MNDNYRPGETIPPKVGENRNNNNYNYNNSNSNSRNGYDFNGQSSSYSYHTLSPYEMALKDGKTSMILGIVACCCTIFNVFGILPVAITGIIGLLKGSKARKILKPQDKGKATAGFVCSIVALGMAALILLIAVFIGVISGSFLLNHSDELNQFGGGYYY